MTQHLLPYGSAAGPAGSSLRGWRLAFGVCLLAVLVLALLPKDLPLPSTGWDKSNHLLAFASLALLGQRGFPGRPGALFAGLLAYSVLIEVVQSFTPNGSAEWVDAIADSAGMGLGWAAGWLARCRRWPIRQLNKIGALRAGGKATAVTTTLPDACVP